MINTFEILDDYLEKFGDFKLDLEKSDISVDNFVASILQFIINIIKPKNIIELGALYGRSAILMSKFAPEAKIYSIENNKRHFQIATKNVMNYDLSEKIYLHLGDCMEILNSDKMKNLHADILFIDANKAKYLDYLNWGCEFLQSNGVIIADNVFIHKVLEKYQDENNIIHKNMEVFLAKIYDKNLFNTITIPYKRDGISVMIKN